VKTRRLLFWCALVAAAFGVVEAAVVVYLREIFYPEGFAFPLKEIPRAFLATEIAREAATILVLLGVAQLAVRGALRRFAVFSFCFGAWDLAYYAGLKAILDWPSSLLTFDVLFLIPLPWTGPVLAPVLVSIALVATAVLLLRLPASLAAFRPVDWAVEVLAGLAILASFFWNLPAVEAGEVPVHFPWWLFLLGYGVGVGWFLLRLWKAATEARRSLR